MSRSLVNKWHKRFEDGWTESLNGKSGRPREINATTVDNVNDATGDRPCAKLVKNWD